MEILIINQSEVPLLLPMEECIEVMAGALMTTAEEDVILPLRPVMWLPENIGAMGMMPVYNGLSKMMGLKVVTVFPGNEGTVYDSHQGAVMLFEARHGRLLALMDSSSITAIRTGGTSGAATRLLARPEANDLAILGSGVQARSHLEAMLLVRDISRVRIWSRTIKNAHVFAQRESSNHDLEIEVCETAGEAVSNADIICTTTASPKPVLLGEMVSSGAHINAVGSSVPGARELDTDLIKKSSMFVDLRESVLNEAGDFLIPKQEGAIDDSHIVGEVGEVLGGKIRGRESDREITLFKSVGLAVEDLAAAEHIYRKAGTKNLGRTIELGGARYPT